MGVTRVPGISSRPIRRRPSSVRTAASPPSHDLPGRQAFEGELEKFRQEQSDGSITGDEFFVVMRPVWPRDLIHASNGPDEILVRRPCVEFAPGRQPLAYIPVPLLLRPQFLVWRQRLVSAQTLRD